MLWQQFWQRRGRPDRSARLLLGATATAVPILLDANRFGIHTETCELRPLAQAALELGEAGEARQR